jgi:O-acetylhomoserine (thiol)-lyase
MDEKAQAAAGVYPDLLRLSVGLENMDDIKDDLENAFSLI